MGGGISSSKRAAVVSPPNRQQSPSQSVRVSARSAPLETRTSLQNRRAPESDTIISPEGHTDSPHQNNERTMLIDSEVSLAIAFTPRENEKSSAASSFSGVPYTPHGDEASIFKYYCPLCMQYFKQILKMKCCSNYLCVQCCKDYVGTKGVKMAPNDGIAQVEERFVSSNSMYCPHCQVSGFHPIGVRSEEVVRDYQSSFVPQHNHNSIAAYSPLRVGETFEDLKRKMVPYKSFLTASTANDEAAPDEQVEAYDPLSPLGMMHSLAVPGIAMLSGAGDETPTLRSPRMRLEPETPGQVSFSLYNPDHSGRGSHFEDDAQADQGGNSRLFTEEQCVSGDHTDSTFQCVSTALNFCFGGDSPRVSSDQRYDRPHAPSHGQSHTEVSRSATLDRPPLSRVNSIPRVAVDDSALIACSRHTDDLRGGTSNSFSSEKSRLRGHCSQVATGMVDHMVRSALAQYGHCTPPIDSQ